MDRGSPGEEDRLRRGEGKKGKKGRRGRNGVANEQKRAGEDHKRGREQVHKQRDFFYLSSNFCPFHSPAVHRFPPLPSTPPHCSAAFTCNDFNRHATLDCNKRGAGPFG